MVSEVSSKNGFAANLRTPDALKLTGGNVADNWKRFKEQFANYELAADLSDASQEKRAAVFLTCIATIPTTCIAQWSLSRTTSVVNLTQSLPLSNSFGGTG